MSPWRDVILLARRVLPPGELRCAVECYRRRQMPATITSLPSTDLACCRTLVLTVTVLVDCDSVCSDDNEPNHISSVFAAFSRCDVHQSATSAIGRCKCSAVDSTGDCGVRSWYVNVPGCERWWLTDGCGESSCRNVVRSRQLSERQQSSWSNVDNRHLRRDHSFLLSPPQLLILLDQWRGVVVASLV